MNTYWVQNEYMHCRIFEIFDTIIFEIDFKYEIFQHKFLVTNFFPELRIIHIS